MADVEAPKRRTFRKFTYRGVDLEQLLDMGTEELIELLPARARRKLHRGLKRKPLALIKKLRNAKKSAEGGEHRWRLSFAMLYLIALALSLSRCPWYPPPWSQVGHSRSRPKPVSGSQQQRITAQNSAKIVSGIF